MRLKGAYLRRLLPLIMLSCLWEISNGQLSLMTLSSTQLTSENSGEFLSNSLETSTPLGTSETNSKKPGEFQSNSYKTSTPSMDSSINDDKIFFLTIVELFTNQTTVLKSDINDTELEMKNYFDENNIAIKEAFANVSFKIGNEFIEQKNYLKNFLTIINNNHKLEINEMDKKLDRNNKIMQQIQNSTANIMNLVEESIKNITTLGNDENETKMNVIKMELDAIKYFLVLISTGLFATMSIILIVITSKCSKASKKNKSTSKSVVEGEPEKKDEVKPRKATEEIEREFFD